MWHKGLYGPRNLARVLVQGRPSRRVLTRCLSVHDAYGIKPFPNRTILPPALEEALNFLASVCQKTNIGIQGAGVKHAGMRSQEKDYLGSGESSLMDRI